MRNKSPITLKGLEELGARAIDTPSWASATTRLDIPVAPETDYEPQWDGLGDKVMALLITFDPGLTLQNPRLNP